MADMKYTVQVDTKGATKNVNALGGAFGGLKKLGAAAAVVLVAKAVYELGKVTIEAAKRFETYNNQLRLITDGQEDLDRVMNKLTQTAIANRTGFADTIDLFSKLTLATADLRVSEEDVLRVTTALSQALAVAGADAATTSSVVRQFGQAMASGTVRGDEFNSLVEGLGPALAIMARETGLNVGTLRKMSREGELTAEVMFDMLKNSESLTAAFNSQAITTEQLETATKDAFDRALVQLDKQIKLSETYKSLLKDITRLLDFTAGTETALVNMSEEQILSGIEDGTISASSALEEFQERVEDLHNSILVFTGTDPLINSINGVGAETMLTAESFDNFIEKIRLARESGEETDGFFKQWAKSIFGLQSNTRFLTDEFIEQYQATRELQRQIEGLAEAQAAAAAAAKDTMDKQIAADKAYADWTTTVNGLAKAITDSKTALDEETKGKFLTDIEKAQKEFDGTSETVRVLTEAIANLNASGNSQGIIDVTERTEELQNNLDAATKAMDFADAALTKLTKSDYVTWFEDLVKNSKETVQEQGFVTQALKDLDDQVKAGTLSLAEYLEATEGLVEADAYTEWLNDLVKSSKETVQEQGFVTQALKDLEDQLKSGALTLAEYKEATDGLVEDDAYAEWLEDLIEKSKETLQEQEFITQALKDLEDQLKSGTLTLAEYNEAVDIITDAFGALRDIVGDVDTLKEYEAVQASINQAFNDGKIDLKEYNDLMEALKAKYKELDPIAQAFAGSLSTAGDALADDLMEGRDALDSFKDFFKSIVKNMIKEAIKLFFIRKLLGGIAGAFGYDVSFGSGSTITDITKRAKGGPVSANTPYIVGEQGQELFIPNTAGKIVPNNALGGGGGAPVTNNYITNNINALDSRSVAQVFAENRQSLLGTVEYARKETSYGV